MKTIWLPIKDWEGLYEVSNKGKVRSVRYSKKRMMTPIKHYRYNYVSVSIALSKEGKTRHNQLSRLVAQAFIPNPLNKKEVNHIDNDAQNNKVENLEWISHYDNMQWAKKQGRIRNAYTSRILDLSDLKSYPHISLASVTP